MKYVFESGSLTQGKAPPEEASRAGTVPARDGRQGDGWWKGTGIRLVTVVALASLFLFIFARRTLFSILAGTATLVLQLLTVEIIFGVLLQRGRRQPPNERAVRRRRFSALAWCVDVVVGVLELAAFAAWVQ